MDEEPDGGEDVDVCSTISPIPRFAATRGRYRVESPLWSAQPNAGHRAIVDIERPGKLHGVVTQNIDELHQKAGTDPELVIEVHGTAVVDPVHVVR